jgi:predicted Zn-dependent protease
MSTGAPLVPALEAAATELQRRAGRWEAFTRLGESLEIRGAGDRFEERSARQVGVACRIALDGRAGFGAAAGSAPRAGKEAARAAAAALLPGDDPLPPREALGSTPVAADPTPFDPAELRDLAGRLAAALARGGVDVRELRVIAGRATSALLTGEGFAGRAAAGSCLVEVLASANGPLRHLQAAGRAVAELDPLALAVSFREQLLLSGSGIAPSPGLTDVLVAPAVAAPLVLAIFRAVSVTGHAPPPPHRIAPAWEVLDARPGPEGLLPLPFDGEGLPSRRIRLAGAGALGFRLATWGEAIHGGGEPGGAVRPSYRNPPHSGPANLVVVPLRPSPPSELLERLGDGLYLVLPGGSPRLADGRLTFTATGVSVRNGRPAATHTAIELRASTRRLLASLEATGGDPASFSLAAAVTTPSLLFRRLEVR